MAKRESQHSELDNVEADILSPPSGHEAQRGKGEGESLRNQRADRLASDEPTGTTQKPEERSKGVESANVNKDKDGKAIPSSKGKKNRKPLEICSDYDLVCINLEKAKNEMNFLELEYREMKALVKKTDEEKVALEHRVNAFLAEIKAKNLENALLQDRCRQKDDVIRKAEEEKVALQNKVAALLSEAKAKKFKSEHRFQKELQRCKLERLGFLREMSSLRRRVEEMETVIQPPAKPTTENAAAQKGASVELRHQKRFQDEIHAVGQDIKKIESSLQKPPPKTTLQEKLLNDLLQEHKGH